MEEERLEVSKQLLDSKLLKGSAEILRSNLEYV